MSKTKGFVSSLTRGKPEQHQRFIDGLRGVAVLIVVAFHLNVPHFCPGGFIGVDVFLALSGYLITRNLASELQKCGTVSLQQFAARRAARLLPMSAVTLAAITAAGAVCLWPADRRLLADDVRSAALNYANWHFQARSADYFDEKTSNSFALHFWSLAVEEQFYVLWPLLHWVCGWMAPARRMSVLLSAVLAITFISWFFSWSASMSDVGLAYYSLASRAWELGAGGLLALWQLRCHAVDVPPASIANGVVPATTVPADTSEVSRSLPACSSEAVTFSDGVVNIRVRTKIPTTGGVLVPALPSMQPVSEFARRLGLASLLSLVVLSGVYTSRVQFPGAGALAPVGLTLVLLALGERSDAGGLWMTILEWRPLVHVGKLSYSLYLLHWPVLKVAALYLPEGSAQCVAAAIAVAYLLSLLCNKFIETPLRVHLPRWHVALGALAAVAVVACASAAILRQTGVVSDTNVDEAAATKASAVVDRAWSCYNVPPARAFDGSCTFGESNSTTRMLVIGDSHAVMHAPAFAFAAEAAGLHMTFWSAGACAFILVPASEEHIFPKHCVNWKPTMLGLIHEQPAWDIVVLLRYLAPPGRNEANAIGLPALLDDFERHGVARHVILMRDNPSNTLEAQHCFEDFKPGSNPDSCNFRLADSPYTDALGWRIAQKEANARLGRVPQIHLLDMNPTMCSNTTCRTVTPDGQLMYRDGHHMQPLWALSHSPLLATFLADVLASRFGESLVFTAPMSQV